MDNDNTNNTPKAILGDVKPIVVSITREQAVKLLARELPETITATFKINPEKGNLVIYSVNGTPVGRMPESKYSSQWKASPARAAAALAFILSDSTAENPRLATKATRGTIESETLDLSEMDLDGMLGAL